MAASSSAAAIHVVMVVSCCLLAAVCSAACKFPPCDLNKIVVVGGSENWRFGFNYSDWAQKNGPFHLYDTLVFKYDPPSNTTFPHSVYLLPNEKSFSECDLTAATRVGNWSQGAGDGFQFLIQNLETHYFACGERNGFHCSNGTMKFSVQPQLYY